MQVLRRKDILHRALAMTLCLAIALGTGAQQTRKRKGPRALALVEWPANGGTPRVIPVAILVDGRFYDASIYKADPVPMALEPGNVYEVEQSGESLGMATLMTARQGKNGAWLADARFQTNEQLAAARKPREAPKSAAVREAPPKLRRGGRRSDRDNTPQPQSAPEPKSEPQASDDSDRPVLRKPVEAPSAETKPSAPQSPTTPSAERTAPQPEDTDRPVLRRGRPTTEQAENLSGAVEGKAAAKAPATAARPTPATAKTPAQAGRVLAAISDADGPEPHTYALPWKAEELERLKAAMKQMASAALQEWARAHGGAHPGALQDVQVRAFDLNTSNEPQVILMAHAVEAGAPAAPARRASVKTGKPVVGPAPSSSSALTFWITLAARQDYNGELRKLKVWASDSKHLDAYPRAELIDAVDADGNGRGELLFREISDIGQSFVLYRATPDTLTQLFNSAELER